MRHRYLAGALMACMCCAAALAKTHKAVYIIIDGVPADMIERLQPPAIYDIAKDGAYGRAYTGGEIGAYSQTPTISAIGYTNLLTATWVNKHNVTGNDNLKPNYNYWTIFRIAKSQSRYFTTALYSSWTDNRTVLLGEGKPETGNLKIDYVADGYDHDTTGFAKREDELQIFDIDEHVSRQAAEGIRRDGPDLSWVYLWYTDDAGHIKGNGTYFDNYVRKADEQVARIWQSVKYREAHYDEEWMIVVTTDHGRTECGHHHGGQSLRERTTWVATNVAVNRHFTDGTLAITDIAPSISRFMGFTVPRDVLWEQDGMPFVGDVDIHNLRATPYDDTVVLSWDNYGGDAPVTVYTAASNLFRDGGHDEWIRLADLPAGTTQYTVDMAKLPRVDFFKFVVQAPNNHLNRWLP